MSSNSETRHIPLSKVPADSQHQDWSLSLPEAKSPALRIPIPTPHPRVGLGDRPLGWLRKAGSPPVRSRSGAEARELARGESPCRTSSPSPLAAIHLSVCPGWPLGSCDSSGRPGLCVSPQGKSVPLWAAATTHLALPPCTYPSPTSSPRFRLYHPPSPLHRH